MKDNGMKVSFSVKTDPTLQSFNPVIYSIIRLVDTLSVAALNFFCFYFIGAQSDRRI